MSQQQDSSSSSSPVTMSAADQRAAAQQVAAAFIRQYYRTMLTSPASLYKFYKDDSSVTHSSYGDPTGNTVVGIKDIQVFIESLNYQDVKVKVSAIDAQKSLNGAILVVVQGELNGRLFNECFLLAAQTPKGYYVLNDVLRFMSPEGATAQAAAPAAVAVATPVSISTPPTPEQPARTTAAPAAQPQASPVAAAATTAAAPAVQQPQPQPQPQRAQSPATSEADSTAATTGTASVADETPVTPAQVPARTEEVRVAPKPERKHQEKPAKKEQQHAEQKSAAAPQKPTSWARAVAPTASGQEAAESKPATEAAAEGKGKGGKGKRATEAAAGKEEPKANGVAPAAAAATATTTTGPQKEERKAKAPRPEQPGSAAATAATTTAATSAAPATGAGPAAAAPVKQGRYQNSIYVCKLHTDTTDEELKAGFSQFGAVTQVFNKSFKDHNAFVFFDSKEAVEKALEADGKVIVHGATVNIQKNKKALPPKEGGFRSDRPPRSFAGKEQGTGSPNTDREGFKKTGDRESWSVTRGGRGGRRPMGDRPFRKHDSPAGEGRPHAAPAAAATTAAPATSASS